MAAIARQVFQLGLVARPTTILARCTMQMEFRRGKKSDRKPAQKPKPKPTLASIMDSIQSKGFLRSNKPYKPPADVTERINQILKSKNIKTFDNTKLSKDLNERFELFNQCGEEFNYFIHNSKLCHIVTVGDLKEFYETPVFTTTPFEALQNMEVPPNLHVEQNYHRFNPNADDLFGGKTAFPQSATLVTGLKYKDKYEGHTPEKPWPEKVQSVFKD
ncbi:39S ribosomal protein L50, mitochondrial [Trichogramma pretiosum]|uniref:39S ribosomal protein L50, mitochondrial n=1 Tax=Trichogramma pretiosum TaxID=7493 RepID=UPI0006C93D72|nr:39S ribosomal protein L50, mitochondrial [Trichogramma pretiosum]